MYWGCFCNDVDTVLVHYGKEREIHLKVKLSQTLGGDQNNKITATSG